MPRDSQGLYTLPAGNPVIPGTVIESQWANSTMPDIGQALTESLPRDGSAPMTGNLTLSTLDPTSARHAVSKSYVDKFVAYASGMPIGFVAAYAAGTAPGGFLKCDGAAYSRTTYAELFALIGTIYGSGDGSTTFNVPDLRDEFVRGRSQTRAVGSKQADALKSHTHALDDPGHTHAAVNPAHTHTDSGHTHTTTVTDPGHEHVPPLGQFALTGPGSSVSYDGFSNNVSTSTGIATTGISVAVNSGTAGIQPAAQNTSVSSAQTGLQIGVTGDTETRPRNVAMDYYIKALQDGTTPLGVLGIVSDDTNVIAVDESDPAYPILDIKSNQAFGLVKLDANNKIPAALLPADQQSFLGLYDASTGNNPSEEYPSRTFINGDTWEISVAGTIDVYDPVTNVSAPTLVGVGWALIYLDNAYVPQGWFYQVSSGVQTGGTPGTAGSIAVFDGATGQVISGSAGFITPDGMFYHGAGDDESNTSFGLRALMYNTTGTSNTALGRDALGANTLGYSNTAVGDATLSLNTDGHSNVAVGQGSLHRNTIGESNTALGVGALQYSTGGSLNTAVGKLALGSNTSGNNNTAVGASSLGNNTIGTNNVAVGPYAAQKNTSGTYNIAVGASALLNNQTGNNNVVVGYGALVNDTNANNNVAVGAQALYNCSGGIGNTAVGYGSAMHMTGDYNTVVGAYNGQTGVDLQAVNNHVCLSDGQGNLRGYYDAAGQFWNRGNMVVQGNTTITGGTYMSTVGPDADSQHTLPNVAADTVTLNGATQTLTNKTLTSPVLTGSVTSTGNPSLNLGTGALTAGSGTFSGNVFGNGVRIPPSSGASKCWWYNDPIRGDCYTIGTNWVGSQELAQLPSWVIFFDGRVSGDALSIQRAAPGGLLSTIGAFSSTGLSLGSLGLTAGSGTFSGNVTVGDGGASKFIGLAGDNQYMRIHGSNAVNQGGGILLFGGTSGAPNVGRLITGDSTVAEWSSTGLSVNGSGTFSGTLQTTSTEQASNLGTGAMQSAGGLSVAKNIWVGGSQFNASPGAIDYEMVQRGAGGWLFYTDSATKVPLKIDRLAPTNACVISSTGLSVNGQISGSDGSNYKYIISGDSNGVNHFNSNSSFTGWQNSHTGATAHYWYIDAVSGTPQMTLDNAGNLIHAVNPTAPALATNRTMTFELTSDTQLKIVVRGSDGVTRSASLTLTP